MNINCSKSVEEKKELRKQKINRKTKWHQWFAWHPVRVGPKHFQWLEMVERKGDFDYHASACRGDIKTFKFEHRALSN